MSQFFNGPRELGYWDEEKTNTVSTEFSQNIPSLEYNFHNCPNSPLEYFISNYSSDKIISHSNTICTVSSKLVNYVGVVSLTSILVMICSLYLLQYHKEGRVSMILSMLLATSMALAIIVSVYMILL